MRPVILKCPLRFVGLLVVGAIALLAIIPTIPKMGWPTFVAWIISGVALILIVYAMTLLPTRLVISDDGIRQKLFFSEWRLHWEEITEWRHCEGGEEFEESEMRERTKGKWHGMEFWVRDKAGKRYYLKRWLVYGRRSKEIADNMRQHGIEGG